MRADLSTPKVFRCAIYTRQSVQDGVDLDFNTLDAQRESALAYISSQRDAGWVALPERYDDAGYTGANTDRPALNRLMADVEAGKVDCIAVYKIDRLSRSLVDFTQILQSLEKHGATFLSVTQQLNSTTPMGKFTLNILISFGEFERQMIADRTRDKMRAARRRGKWIGGMMMLGYDVVLGGGRIVVNEQILKRIDVPFSDLDVARTGDRFRVVRKYRASATIKLHEYGIGNVFSKSATVATDAEQRSIAQ